MRKKTIVCLAVLLVLALCLTACGNSPRAVAKTYMNAFSRGDINKMIDCMDPDSAALLNGITELLGGQLGVGGETLTGMSPALFSMMDAYYGYNIDYRITGETIHGDSAIVTIEYDVTMDGDEGITREVREIPLVKIDGKWYVSGLA